MTLAGFIFSARIAIRLTVQRRKSRHSESHGNGNLHSANCLENQPLIPLEVVFKKAQQLSLLVLF